MWPVAWLSYGPMQIIVRMTLESDLMKKTEEDENGETNFTSRAPGQKNVITDSLFKYFAAEV